MKTTSVSLGRLQKAFLKGRLTLYLGAGCSVASGIPSWDRLVTQLYMNGINRHLPSRFLSVPGLVASVGQWAFARQVVPLEVAARKLRGYYRDDSEFLYLTQMMLYGLTGYYGRRGRLRAAELREVLAANTTLQAVSSLCLRSQPGRRGVSTVISYNYDDFLERSLGTFPHQPIWRPASVKSRTLPIFHVHGYIPDGGRKGSKLEEIVLTEDQYNQAAQNSYSWQNLVQINALSGSVGLMVGLSLTDRNLRRILDALKSLPHPVENYALLQRPKSWTIDDHEIDIILGKMKDRVQQGFAPGYGDNPMALIEKAGTREKIVGAVRALEKRDLKQEETTLNQLGVRAIWYEDHAEVKEWIDQIGGKARQV